MIYSVGKTTAPVNTDIIVVCPARGTMIARVDAVCVSAGGADQYLYFMTPLGITWSENQTKAGSTTTKLATSSPMPGKVLTTNSVLVAINQNAQFELLTVQSLSGNTITWKSGPSADIPIGSLFYAYYNPQEGETRVPPTDASFHPRVRCRANQTTTLSGISYESGKQSQEGGRISGIGVPVALMLTNDFSAATLEYCRFSWYEPTDEERDYHEGRDEEAIMLGNFGRIEVDDLPDPIEL